MIVRQFNPSGITEFKGFLAQCRLKPQTPIPPHLLEGETLTEIVTPQTTVDPKHFGTRREAADDLIELLEPYAADDVAQNDGLWTWVTLFFFDEVCPVHNGRRNVRNDYSYVFEEKKPRHFYRHLLFIAWYAARVAKPKPFDRLYLNNSVSSLDKVTAEVMQRLYLTRIPCVFEVLDRLYWDDSRGKARPGIVDYRSVKPGDLVHRFPLRIRQLEMTYDLMSLTADQLIELLGDEFQRSERAAAMA